MMRLSIAGGSLIALGAALALAGCGSNGAQNNQAAAANELALDNMAMDNGTAAVPAADVPLPAGDNAVVEDASTAPPIQVASVPAPAPTTSAVEAAPLTEATATEQMINAGTGITRVQQPDGWAWLQKGQIIRTASADGRRVAYFHRGDATPYFVQQNGRGYAYSHGQPMHEFDAHGRISTPDAQQQHEARDLADAARRRHDSAQQASRTAPHVDRSHDRQVHVRGSQPPVPAIPNAGDEDHRGTGDTDHSGSDNRSSGGGNDTAYNRDHNGSRTTANNRDRQSADRHDRSAAADQPDNRTAPAH